MTRLTPPDYSNCIANIPNSILRWFDIQDGRERKTLATLDRELEKDYKNVVLLLLDGMGSQIMRNHLEPEGFLCRHWVTDYSSVFPPTTVAATTSVQCGLEPCEHSWLGWDCYFEELDKNVTVFRNTLMGTDEPAADFLVADTYCPYTSIVDMIRTAGGQAYNASPFAEPYPQNLQEISRYIQELCRRDGKKYIYAYWTEPDHTMHELGVNCLTTRMLVRDLEEKVEELCASLEDTLVIVTADHGHINADTRVLEDYPEITACMMRYASIEPRTLAFAVKEGCHERFEQLFKEAFGDKFVLLTREEIRRLQYFGKGPEHPHFASMLGDYVAIAVGDLCLSNEHAEYYFVGTHAGMTKAEMEIPLIFVGKS